MREMYKDMLMDIMSDDEMSINSDNIDNSNDILGDSLFEISDDDLDVIDSLSNHTDRLSNPGENINIVEITQSANGKIYKFYVIPVTDYINEEFAVYIKHKDKNTKGYLFPTFENVYNNRYLDEVVNSGNFRTITTNEFTDEMYESISDDLEYKLFVKFLQLFTLKKGVVIHGI